MPGFHTATICTVCHPPIVAISTGHGSHCPGCGQIEEWPPFVMNAIDTNHNKDLASQILTNVAIRSDGDARLLSELARRLLNQAEKCANGEEDEEVATGGASKVAPEVTSEVAPQAAPVITTEDTCPHCQAKEPSVWDGELFHYAHPTGSMGKLKMCHSPWRARCLRCSADVPASKVKFCTQHASPLTEI